MQAVFQLSGFQFSATEGDVIRVPHQAVAVGQTFDIDQVLLLKDKDTSAVGTPIVAGARIKAELLANGKNDKVIVYKFKKRTKYRRTRGHRQDYSDIKILKVVSPS
jgi:large subunit ribosomal protein L21